MCYLNILTSPDNNEHGMVEQSDDILTDFFLKSGNELSNLIRMGQPDKKLLILCRILNVNKISSLLK